MGPERKEARRAWDKARRDLANDRAATEDTNSAAKQNKDTSSTLNHPFDTISSTRLSDYKDGLAKVDYGARGRTAHIDDEQENFVDESQYRQKRKYRRHSQHNSPGRHADSSWQGFEDTSGFRAPVRENSSPPQHSGYGTGYPPA